MTLVDAASGNLKGSMRSLEKAELDALIAFNRDYLFSETCKAERKRQEGEQAPGSGSYEKFVVDGAFTKPFAKQTLVTFFVGNCGLTASHSENWGKTFALIFEGGRIVDVSTDGPTQGYALLAIDFDHDGLSEVVEYTGDYAAGTTFSGADVWSYRGGRPHSVATFELFSDSCTMPHGEHYESTLHARWDQSSNKLCFLARRRDLTCPPRADVGYE